MASPGINPVTVLKRNREEAEIDWNPILCAFCQSQKSDPLRAATCEGKKRVADVVTERRKLRDTSCVELLESLGNLINSDWTDARITWHKSCYSSFTSESKLTRLRKSVKSVGQVSEEKSTHSPRNTYKWNSKFCIFCQIPEEKKLHNVSTKELSEKIISLSKRDVTMMVRLANVIDLIADEGKYHLKCLRNFERKTNKKSHCKEQVTDPHIEQLGADLLNGLARGHVFDMGQVWDQYIHILKEDDIQVPNKYVSRRKTFYDDIMQIVGQKGNFIRPLDPKAPLLLYPSDKSDFVIAKALGKAAQETTSYEDDCYDSLANTYTNEFTDLVHVALQLRKDLEQTPGHSAGWRGIDHAHVQKVIPNSLYMFLSVLFGGTTALEDEPTYNEELMKRVCNVAQDIVFVASKNQKLTPKHVGMGLALHQATRSEYLVDLFHAAGHIIGYDTIRRIDTTIASQILQKFEENGYVYVPENISPSEPGRMILSSCDNIDVLEETLDGKNTFHCTQMVVWQRGPAPPRVNGDFQIGREKALKKDVLAELHSLHQAKLLPGTRPQPVIANPVNIDVDRWLAESPDKRQAAVKNLAWLLTRICNHDDQHVPAWAAFNEACSSVNPPITTAGLLPILQAPADNNDTLTTVIDRFVSISKHLQQKHTIIAMDQPLYSRGKELIWSNPGKYSDVILLLGDLHILFNFLKVIGQHLESSGLEDIWIETGLFGPNTTDSMMEGKAYYRAVRGHTLAYEALWRLWWTKFVEWVGESECLTEIQEQVKKLEELFHERKAEYNDEIHFMVNELCEVLEKEDLNDLIHRFHAKHQDEPNYAYWTNYMKMVEILLDFIRSNREGNWKLHVDTFAMMLPWLTIYDHTNYARWGPVYLADIKALSQTAPEVYREFLEGNFVIKRSDKRFNQVPMDQATEWMNRMCKLSNGIIGITRNDTARDRFCATWSERSCVSHDIKTLLGLVDTDEAISTRKEALPTRLKYDEEAVNKLWCQFKRADVFASNATSCESDQESILENDDDSGCSSQLISLATRDVASDDIKADLLQAQERGKSLLKKNVLDRLVTKTVPFFDPLKKHNSRTFSTLYKATVSTKEKDGKIVKADRKLIQQLFNVSQAGRKVEMANILKHELSHIPLSLGKTSGVMNSTAKSEMLKILTEDYEISTPSEIPHNHQQIPSCVLIDGHALIQKIGKPSECSSFGDYANVFIKAVCQYFFGLVSRVDVAFDRYIGSESIKAPTRQKRTGKKRPIRKVIDNDDVPLPQVWSQFISLDENKSNLAEFLSQKIVNHGTVLPDAMELITGGGFHDPYKAYSSNLGWVAELGCNHEEADTRLIFHALQAVNSGFERLLVVCQDTDVLLLLLHFLGPQPVETWMVSGTAYRRKCYPIHEISSRLSQPVIDNILGFHALTGCDTTSSIAGHGKRSCWKKFQDFPLLLHGVGRDGAMDDVEEYVCRLYGAPTTQGGVDKGRYEMFQKGKKTLELLPPTKDALELHVQRANFQAKVWLKADSKEINTGSPTSTGAWRNGPDGLEIIWSRLPSVPDACIELTSCGCKTKCRTAACKCSKTGQRCTPACGCNAEDCCNPAGLGSDD